MKKFIRRSSGFVLITIFLTVVPIIGVNLVLDPYGLINKKDFYFKTAPNLRTLKRDKILNKEKINNQGFNLLFSDSRGGVYTTDDKNFYNMSYPDGHPREFIEDVEYLVKSGLDIDNVIVLIDENAIFNDPEHHKKQPSRKLYEDNEFDKYLIPINIEKIKQILLFDENKKHVRYYLGKDGAYEYVNFELLNKIEITEVDYVTKGLNRKLLEKAVGDIKKMVSKLDELGVSYNLGVHPISYENFDVSEEKEISHLKELTELLKKENIPLFNNLEVVKNSSVYYDWSHYSPFVANYVLKKLDKYNTKK